MNKFAQRVKTTFKYILRYIQLVQKWSQGRDFFFFTPLSKVERKKNFRRKGPADTEHKKDSKDSKRDNKSAAPKLTTKERLKAFFTRKKQHDNPTIQSTMRTETETEMEEFASTTQLEKIKNDLKGGGPREQASKWVDAVLDKGVSGLEMEFEKMNKAVETGDTSAFNANADRNLTMDVVCQNEHRVLLKNEDNHYIHANYINTPGSDKHFICTQRPMETTVETFYKMLLQEQVEYIVMLCNFAEKTEKQCPEYFPQAPSDKPMIFGPITVKCTNASNMKNEADVRITTLEIKGISDKKLTVKHFHWKNWPERGLPEPTLTIINLLCVIRTSKKPIVVHCSDGVGRSGVFVAVEYMLQKIQRGESCENVEEMIKEIRKQRAMAIKTVSQYVLFHRLFLHFFQDIKIADMSQRLLEFIDDYDRFTKKHKDDE